MTFILPYPANRYLSSLIFFLLPVLNLQPISFMGWPEVYGLSEKGVLSLSLLSPNIHDFITCQVSPELSLSPHPLNWRVQNSSALLLNFSIRGWQLEVGSANPLSFISPTPIIWFLAGLLIFLSALDAIFVRQLIVWFFAYLLWSESHWVQQELPRK